MSDDNASPRRIRQEVHAAGEGTTVVAGHITTQNINTTTSAGPPPAPTALHSLPPDLADFTGRDSELRRLLEAAGPQRVLSVHAVDGMPGIGKTALATHVAHRLREQYPDGQLFEALHAHTPGHRPARPTDVLADLLTRLGITAQQLPATLEGRQALWRDQTAGQRLLVFLDDAVGHAQVAPLIPSGSGCLTLITSRRRLIGLDGALSLSLEVLPVHEAEAMFRRLARRPVDASAAAALRTLVELCGCLPLAIALLAGRFSRHDSWTLPWLAGEFADTQDRLGELRAGDRPGDLAVRTAFAMSYEGLPPERQRVFRFLSLHPGLDTDPYAAAALSALPLADARWQLEELYTDHLLDETAPGRFRLHDLLRAYARALGEQSDPVHERGQALAQLLDYYEHTTHTADSHLRSAQSPRPLPVPPPAAMPALPHRRAALTWLRAERANLVACLDDMREDASRTIRLTVALTSFLRLEGPWAQAAGLLQRAATAARHTGDRAAEADALVALGAVRFLTGHYPQAIHAHERALTLYNDLGDRHGQANAIYNRGHALLATGRFDGAEEEFRTALALYRKVRDRRGQTNALYRLGELHLTTGDFRAASPVLEECLKLCREYGDASGVALASLGLARVGLGTGDLETALRLLQKARADDEESGFTMGLAATLDHLGSVHRAAGRFDEAVALHHRALSLFQDFGHRSGQANTLHHLGEDHFSMGEYGATAPLLEESLALFVELGDGQGQAEVLNSKAALLAAVEGPARGLGLYQEALRIALSVHGHLDEARALTGAARCQAQLGERAAAVRNLRRGVDILRRIGSADAGAAAALLAELEGHGPDEPAAVRG
ncbi:tetratricopeptide repeat protein [Streptomyces sp. NPDC002677]|uniref:ATP-binding protein n=1 Tax=Streptomyces sp. NPDC002677 TaxID=3154774 RepID=UPI00331CB4EC